MGKTKFSGEDLSRWKREINPAPIIGSRVSLCRENSEWVGTCPPCFHDKILGHPDKTPSFKIWKLDDGTWGYKCFGCQANGNVYQFVQAFDGIPFGAAVEKVLQEAGVSGWEDGTAQPEPSMPESAPKEHVTFPIAQYRPAEVALYHSLAGQKWLTDRGITMETASRYFLGFVQDASVVCGPAHPWRDGGWITFPTLSDDGRTVLSVKYRSLVGKKAKIDGKSVSGIFRAQNTATMLFNLRDVTPAGDVWLVEGEPDTVVLAQAGLTAVGLPSNGHVLSEMECERLSSAKRRFLAGDNDPAGNKAMDGLKQRLRGATYRIIWPNNRKDANDVLTNECGNDADKFKTLVDDLKMRATQTESLSIVRRADQIIPKKIQWMWPGKIPFGKLTLFAGNPDNGKSLASTSVAAICSTGGAFSEDHFDHEPVDVLMLIGEDDADDTAVPRLMAAGANLKRIHFLEAVRPPALESREVRLDIDIPTIERQLEENPNIRLLIIDPISNYLGEVSMIAEQEVRSILIPLKRMAEKHNIAVIIVMHLNKKNDLDAISRVGGAMAFIGVARCSWLFARNVQETPEQGEDITPAEKKPDTFSMLRIKNNLVSSTRAGLAYSVVVRPIAIEGEMVQTPYVVWGTVIEGNADDALNRRQTNSTPGAPRPMGRPNDKLQKAIHWLESALQDNQPHRTKLLRESAKGEANITSETLDRAWGAIGAKSVKIGGHYNWQWTPLNPLEDNEGETAQASELFRIEGAE